MNNCVQKIIDNNDKYIIFYSEWCSYSMKAVNLLENKNAAFKGYKIDKMDGGKDALIKKLSDSKKQLEFDPSWSTRPIIFYKGKFVGGYTELIAHFATMNK